MKSDMRLAVTMATIRHQELIDMWVRVEVEGKLANYFCYHLIERAGQSTQSKPLVNIVAVNEITGA